MTATASASITLNPKIKDAQSAQREMVNFVKNPPTNPVDAVKKFGSMLGVGSVVSAGLTAAFPFAAPILPMLSGIFDLFSDAPSLGEMTLDAINSLSTQLNEGLNNLREATESIVKEQAQLTIDVVLQGSEQIAREASAVSVFRAIAVDTILEETLQEKKAMYIEFLQEMQDYREKALSNLSGEIEKAQNEINEKYMQLLGQVYGMIAEIAPAMLDALDNFLALQESGQGTTRAIDQDTPALFQEKSPSASAQAGDNKLLLLGAAVAAGGVAFWYSQKNGKKS